VKLAYPILRSREDGHQVTGPACADRIGVDAYIRAFRANKVVSALWTLEGVVWVSERAPPEGFGLYADFIEPTPSRRHYAVLRRAG